MRRCQASCTPQKSVLSCSFVIFVVENGRMVGLSEDLMKYAGLGFRAFARFITYLGC